MSDLTPGVRFTAGEDISAGAILGIDPATGHIVMAGRAEPISPFLDSAASEHWRKFRADNPLALSERTDLASAVHDKPGDPCQCSPVYEAVERIIADRLYLLTSEPALAAFRGAWQQADAEGATGDRVRRGMVAAIEAVS